MTTTTENQCIEVGTILQSSWGYDQTNRDFYTAVKVSPSNVWLQRIGSKIVSGDGWAGRVAADPSVTLGKVFQRKLHTYDGEQHVRINSYANAYIWTGEPMSFSSYA